MIERLAVIILFVPATLLLLLLLFMAAILGVLVGLPMAAVKYILTGKSGIEWFVDNVLGGLICRNPFFNWIDSIEHRREARSRAESQKSEP